MTKRKKKAKSTTKRSTANPEVRNAFKLLKHMVKLNDARITGDLDKMPINIMSADESDEPDQIDTHFELVQYVLDLLMGMGFSKKGALNVIFSAKATKDVIRNMFVK